jgi:hypothetical protein
MGGQFIWGCHTRENGGTPDKCAVWKDHVAPENLIDKRPGGSQIYNNFLVTGYKGRCVVSFTVPGSCARNAYHGAGKSELYCHCFATFWLAPNDIGAEMCRPLESGGVPDP